MNDIITALQALDTQLQAQIAALQAIVPTPPTSTDPTVTTVTVLFSDGTQQTVPPTTN